MTYHVPFCLNCGNNEVQAPYFYGTDGDGFCSHACEKQAAEGFQDDADWDWFSEADLGDSAPRGEDWYLDAAYEDRTEIGSEWWV